MSPPFWTVLKDWQSFYLLIARVRNASDLALWLASNR